MNGLGRYSVIPRNEESASCLQYVCNGCLFAAINKQVPRRLGMTGAA
jgi:hypothetical protein